MSHPEQTARLQLIPLAAEHLVPYTTLIAQPLVHRHLSRAREIAADPEGQARRIIGMSEQQWSKRGLGPYAVFAKEDGRFIGRGGLLFVEHSGEVEVNYMLDPGAWGRGYARELAAKCLEISFGRMCLSKIIATTNPDNVSSRRVLEKLGFALTGEKMLDGGRVVQLHEITQAGWRNRAAAPQA
ncbi:GNAT family N-acetyltransferase [Bosea sp. LjRoot90]|uniref:GNAT family N-acetyltransferase n=1 Tax=Bosea sp. LjRoot90 TaxID=3342342 RepID=UPI003ECD2D9A